MSRGLPSMTALLGLLAIAGYQNRDKLAEILGGSSQDKPAAGGQTGLGGLLGQLGLGGASEVASSLVGWANSSKDLSRAAKARSLTLG